MNVYKSGQLVRTNAVFTNISGTPTDPGTIVLKYKQGNGSTQTVTYPSSPIVRDTAGTYHADLDTTGWSGPGNRLDLQEWTGTGAVQGINDDAYEVEPPLL
jgi:hypothetical protein